MCQLQKTTEIDRLKTSYFKAKPFKQDIFNSILEPVKRMPAYSDLSSFEFRSRTTQI